LGFLKTSQKIVNMKNNREVLGESISISLWVLVAVFILKPVIKPASVTDYFIEKLIVALSVSVLFFVVTFAWKRFCLE